MNKTPKHALARYTAVRCLTDAEAAKSLGVATDTVRAYRRINPEVAYLPEAPKPDRPNVRQANVMTGGDGFSSTDRRPSPISLPKEPWL